MTNTPFLSPFRRFPMSVSYDYYRIFYYVAKYGSFTRAASILMNSQPNITRTIANLEKELDCRLFLHNESLYARPCFFGLTIRVCITTKFYCSSLELSCKPSSFNFASTSSRDLRPRFLTFIISSDVRLQSSSTVLIPALLRQL